MRKPFPARKPWQWRPLVRSRAIECSWFAAAASFSLLYLLALLLHGRKALAAGIEVGAIVLICLAQGVWNRKKRRQEAAHRLLP
jgi:hypothetical protein